MRRETTTDLAAPRPGAIFILVTAVVFGVMPTLARLAYDAGASAVVFQAGRFGVAATALWALHLWRRGFPRVPNLRRAGWVAAMAALTSGVSLGYIGAVEWLPVQRATLTFFTFPLLVGLACHCFGVEKLNRPGAACLLAGFGGLALVIGRGESAAAGGGEWVGYGMAFGASLLAASMFFVLRAAKGEIAGMELTLWVSAASAGIFAAALALGAPSGTPQTAGGWLALLTAGLIYGLGLACLFEGMARVGPLWTAALINLEPVVSLLAAWTILGERLTPPQLAGAALVIGAIVGMRKARAGRGFQPRPESSTPVRESAQESSGGESFRSGIQSPTGQGEKKSSAGGIQNPTKSP